MQVSVLLEPVFAEGGTAITSSIQHLISEMVANYENDFNRRVLRGRGRPSIAIHEEQLVFLLENSFKVVDIARMFGCSRLTIQRRMRYFGIDSNHYSTISDLQLDQLVTNITTRFPSCGIRSVKSRLHVDGVIVQRKRVRESLCRVDPIGLENRLRRTLHRRQYVVASPNALWHIDGHHKLIRWRLVVHGGIDGYSRIPVFLKVAANNKADTVLSAFFRSSHRIWFAITCAC